MIYLGSDHRGFELKRRLYKKLLDAGFMAVDLGNDHLDPGDDFVEYAKKVADAVIQDRENIGIILCGSGVGVDMVANKIPGIRSALVCDVPRARQAREDEDANVLSLPADTLDEETAWEIVQAFLATPFSNKERHLRRLEKIKEVESTSST